MLQEENQLCKVVEKFTQADVTRERRKTFRTLGTIIRILSNNRARLIEQVLYPVAFDSARRKSEGEKRRVLKRATGEGHFA